MLWQYKGEILMDIKLEIAFQQAMEEIANLNQRVILEKSLRIQVEEENKELKEKIAKLEKDNPQ